MPVDPGGLHLHQDFIVAGAGHPVATRLKDIGSAGGGNGHHCLIIGNHHTPSIFALIMIGRAFAPPVFTPARRGRMG